MLSLLLIAAAYARNPFSFAEDEPVMQQAPPTKKEPAAATQWHVQKMNQTTFAVTSTFDGQPRLISLPKK
jgi:hypothetical protein